MRTTELDPRAIARRLIGLARETEPLELKFDVENPRLTNEQVEAFVERDGMPTQVVSSARELVDQLERALDEADWQSEVAVPDGADAGHWAFGEAIIIRGPRREIHRGFLDVFRTIPILNRVPERVALFLIQIEDGEDLLHREHHSGVGWHYHYLNWKEERSDVILCWDTRWKVPNPQTKPPTIRGLFVEKHAEKGKSFHAHPRAWGQRKRATMYEVCDGDLHQRNISEYRCAANKSEPVYPTDAVLTPHPLAGKTKGRRRRR